MLTSSYVSPEMKELHQPAVDAGIMMVNEVGFDPGLDHMLSVQCFDDVHEKGGKVQNRLLFFFCIIKMLTIDYIIHIVVYWFTST